MRYIDIDGWTVTPAWTVKAQNAAASVAAGQDPGEFDSVWRELKDGLSALFHDKCWFCETPIARSDNAVDHFRPKGRCSDAASPHSGYRWLAFEKGNFRYSCTFCNSRRKDLVGGTVGGKADRFPLLNENNRVYTQGPCHHEHPQLLDPCDLNDWELLGCRQEDGSSCPATDDPTEKLRADTSIEVYHLNHEPTSKQRHPLAVTFLGEVSQAKRFFPLAKNDVQMSYEFKQIAQRIKRRIDRKSPYSGEMMFLLKGQRDFEHPWIQKLIEA